MFIKDKGYNESLENVSELLNQWAGSQTVNAAEIYAKIVAYKVRRIEVKKIYAAKPEEHIKVIPDDQTNNKDMEPIIRLLTEWAISDNIYNGEIVYIIKSKKVQDVKIVKGFKHFYNSQEPARLNK